MITGIFAVILTLAIVLLYRQRWTSKSKLPPGPLPLPLIGNFLQLQSSLQASFCKWAAKYGPIFRVKLGPMETIVLNDPKLVKELFSDDASIGRMGASPIVYELSRGAHGVTNAVGEDWKEQRKFTVRTLGNFGFSSTSMEGSIIDELLPILDFFEKSAGNAIPSQRIFTAPVLNSLWHIVSGERCKWEDGLVPLLETSTQFFWHVNNVGTNGLLFAPILRFFAPKYFGWDKYLQYLKATTDFFSTSIEEHKRTFDRNNLRDFIDHFLLEMENTTDPKSSFYKGKGECHLIAGVFDLFLGGSETTANLISWTLLFLSHHQHIQSKLQMEIDTQLGTRLPSLSHKIRMPYTDAIMSEVMRRASVVAVGIPRSMVEDIMFHGYHIPKGAAVFANMHGINHDPKIWGDPYKFRPERFLNAEGNSYVGHEALMPFSYGKRRCIGENLGRNTLFIFVTGIFQRFRILPDPSCVVKPDFEPDLSVIQVPKPFKIVAYPRNT